MPKKIRTRTCALCIPRVLEFKKRECAYVEHLSRVLAQAALLVAFEELMDEEEQRDENMFPPWLFTFLPTDQAPDDDDDENGVINGVNRSLAKLREHVDAALGSLLVRTRELDSRLEAHMAEQDQRLLSTHLDPQPVDRQDAIES